MAESLFGATFAEIGKANARIQFELQFNQLQNTLIRRFNQQVDTANARVNSKAREIRDLQKQSVKLSDSLPVIEQYRIGNLNNSGALDALIDEVVALRATISNDNNVTAEEVAAFTAQRDVVAAKLNNLFIFVHPDIADGNVILDLKKELAGLNALTPVVGTLDVDNAGVTTFLNTFQSKAETALSTTLITISTALNLEQKVQADFATRQAKVLELTTVEKAKRDEELEGLQVDLANFLRAISLSFEVNKDFADLVSSGLTKQRPAPGSILNLFS